MSYPLILLFLLAVTTTFTASAQEYNFSYPGILRDIPDQNPFGVTDVHTITVAPGATITDINVSLAIDGTGSGGFNGDLYVTLQHQSGFSVLLNRPGARPGTPSGYSDSGLSVTFDDSSPNDIHSYRLVLSGDENTAISGALTGTWAPDGRNVDPDSVSPSSPRNALLNSFQGLALNGTWTLFVSDLSAGGTQRLDGWSMQVQTVPEPGPIPLAALFIFTAFVFRRFTQLSKGLGQAARRSAIAKLEEAEEL
ncbi:MAG TPA: hypothetical protein VGR78_16410 [Verrucomicrobiae bacterium]|nr:hypothetical protein [Verrucomicrobiae bacterium]